MDVNILKFSQSISSENLAVIINNYVLPLVYREQSVQHLFLLFPAALPRSESTPGLVESAGMIPLEDMWVSPLPLPQHTPDMSPESG